MSEVSGLDAGEKTRFEKDRYSGFESTKNSVRRLISYRAGLLCVNSKADLLDQRSNALDGVVLPKPRNARRFFLTREEIVKILAVAPEPYRTFYWLAAKPECAPASCAGFEWTTLKCAAW